ncbi:FxsA family protein [Pontiella agarivorans]|uniref:FxsA family protein n=1 Tax=Pontiella agarivorans TaxID=3038953 RepID=A0ABU5MVP1_9BACT|nr:FxsA family protein [Pontiella agarivorans]MDZ8118294.1 FxsA family protein [Pontiella agarivorans]
MPLHYLLVLFIGLPILEFALLIKVHGMVGFIPTVLLVLLTGMAGAWLVRRQGVNILFKIRQEMALGNLPAPQMIDGVMILLAGAFLVTPGLITDAAGFALLIPFIRRKIRYALRKKLENGMRNGYIQVNIKRPDNFQ